MFEKQMRIAVAIATVGELLILAGCSSGTDAESADTSASALSRRESDDQRRPGADRAVAGRAAPVPGPAANGGNEERAAEPRRRGDQEPDSDSDDEHGHRRDEPRHKERNRERCGAGAGGSRDVPPAPIDDAGVPDQAGRGAEGGAGGAAANGGAGGAGGAAAEGGGDQPPKGGAGGSSTPPPAGGSAAAGDSGQANGGATAGGGSPTPSVAPKWSEIYAKYLGPNTIGACSDCHDSRAPRRAPLASASEAYQSLVSEGQISGTSSPIAISGQSRLSWLGGDMPPKGPTSEPAAEQAIKDWVAAGAKDN